ncbi:MAG: periplasmic heavy metal sensor [Pararobbsia sp.]
MFRKTPRLLLIAATAFVLVVGQTRAQDDASPCRPSEPAVPFNLKQLHDELNLDPAQEVNWQSVIDAMQQSHSSARMGADEMQVQEQTLLQQPILDLAAVHAAHDKVAQADEQLREKSANAWLSFYKGLSDQQKTLVSAALKPHFAEISKHPARPYEPRTGL